MNESKLSKQLKVNWERFERGEIDRDEYNRRNDMAWNLFAKYAFCRGSMKY